MPGLHGELKANTETLKEVKRRITDPPISETEAAAVPSQGLAIRLDSRANAMLYPFRIPQIDDPVIMLRAPPVGVHMQPNIISVPDTDLNRLPILRYWPCRSAVGERNLRVHTEHP